MKCLINGTVEPVLFSDLNNAGALNRTCVLERHRLLHGNNFLPMFDDEKCYEHNISPIFDYEQRQVNSTLFPRRRPFAGRRHLTKNVASEF